MVFSIERSHCTQSTARIHSAGQQACLRAVVVLLCVKKTLITQSVFCACTRCLTNWMSDHKQVRDAGGDSLLSICSAG